MFREALSLYRRHFRALLLTAALALVPGTLLMGGALVYGIASLRAASVVSDAPQPESDQAVIRLRQPVARASAETALDALPFHALLPVAYSIFVAVAILIGMLTLAHAALVAVVVEVREGQTCGAARAWAIVASRFGAIVWTGLLGVVAVAVASLFLVVPGVVLAIGFAFAVPAALLEGISGREALERSWSLTARLWPRVIGVFACIAAITAAACAIAVARPDGAWRLVTSGIVAALAYPVPLAALVLLYERARRGEGQYIRRISAPG